MTAIDHPLPDISRADVVVVNQWTVGTSERAQAAIAASWEHGPGRRPWPRSIAS
jgi:hypothetical protein